MEPLDREIAEAFTEGPLDEGPGRILIVGAAAGLRSALVGKLTGRRHRCTCVNRLDKAHAALVRGRFDLVVLDVALPDGNGLELARSLQEVSPSTKTHFGLSSG